MDRRIRHHLFEVTTATGWLLIGAAVLINPEVLIKSPIGQQLEVFPYIWASLYIISWPLIMWGVLRGAIAYRVAGLTLLASGLAMNGVAALVVGSFDIRAFVYLLHAAACALRAHYCATATLKSLR